MPVPQGPGTGERYWRIAQDFSSALPRTRLRTRAESKALGRVAVAAERPRGLGATASVADGAREGKGWVGAGWRGQDGQECGTVRVLGGSGPQGAAWGCGAAHWVRVQGHFLRALGRSTTSHPVLLGHGGSPGVGAEGADRGGKGARLRRDPRDGSVHGIAIRGIVEEWRAAARDRSAPGRIEWLRRISP